MSGQVFTSFLIVFVLGLFVGSNLGVVLMCLLQVAGRGESSDVDIVTVAVEIEE